MSREAALAIATGTIAAAAPPAEATPADGAAPPKDELVSTRIAQITKKESEFRSKMKEQEEALKKQREEFEGTRSKFDPFIERYKQFEAMKEKDPVAAIKMLGFSDTDYVNFVAAQEDKSTPEERAAKIADAKIGEFRKEQEDKARAEETKRNEETINQFKKNIGITIKTNGEKFELCNYYGEAAEALIYKTIDEAFAEDLKTNPEAEPMTPEQAAELVESYYEDFHKKALELKKFAPKEEVKEEPVAKKEEPLKAQVNAMPARTLTNKAAPTAASLVAKTESRTEKRERLIRALKEGKL